jgi:hypothetical protein
LPRDVRQVPAMTASLTMTEEEPVAPAAGTMVEEPPAREPRRFVRQESEPSVPPWQAMGPPAVEEEPEIPQSIEVADKRLDAAQGVREPHFAPESFADELPPPMVIRPIQIISTPSEGEERPRIAPPSLLLRPLVWANQSFDSCTTLLGPLGRGMRGNRGRTFLGVVGLLCLGVAGAWLALEQVGWPR